MSEALQVHSTGAKKEPAHGRGRYELMPPHVLERDARLYEYGAAKKYGPRNWEKGLPFSQCIESLFRHLIKFMKREPDVEHEDNMAAIRFWAGALMHYEEMIKRGVLPKSLDDLPTYAVPTAKVPAADLQAVPVPDKTDCCVTSAIECVENDLYSMCRQSWQIEGPKTDIPLYIYVAGPISSDDPETLATNYQAGKDIARALEKMGHLVFCPHDYEVVTTKKYYEHLLDFDLSIIERWATALYFIAPSPGANRERALAKELRLPIYYYIDAVPVVQEKTTKD